MRSLLLHALVLTYEVESPHILPLPDSWIEAITFSEDALDLSNKHQSKHCRDPCLTSTAACHREFLSTMNGISEHSAVPAFGFFFWQNS